MAVKSAPKFVRAAKIDSGLLTQLMGSMPAGGDRKSFLAPMRRRCKNKLASTHIRRPVLPARQKLTPAELWRAHLWMIDTAQAHGRKALQGLAIALARMIQADVLSVLLFDGRQGVHGRGSIDDLLWDRNLPVTKDGRRLLDLLVPTRRPRRFNLGSTALIANPWEPWRLARALQSLGPNCEWGEWRQDKNNHFVAAWYPWPLLWVSNGNHSATAASLKGGGKIRCEDVFEATPLLKVVSTNGRHWFGEDGRALGRVHSMPMAGLIEVGRRLIGLNGRSRP